jgi:hypothetical protein
MIPCRCNQQFMTTREKVWFALGVAEGIGLILFIWGFPYILLFTLSRINDAVSSL